MNSQYEENLWNKIDFLHQRCQKEHTYLTHFLEIMSKFQLACDNFGKTIKAIINKNYILSDEGDSTLNKSIEIFIKCLSTYSQAFNETSDTIKTTILEPISKSISESFQKEKEMYNTYCKTRSIYNSSKSNLEKVHKEFNSRGKDCENLVYNAKKSKMHSLVTHEQLLKLEKTATEALTNTVLCEDKYINILSETNKARENEINSQKKMHNYYQTNDTDYYSKIKTILGLFITCFKKMDSSLTIDIDSLKDKFNRINIENDISDFIEKNKTEAKPDEVIVFIPYKPAPELTSNSIISTNRSNDSKELDVCFEVVVTFKKLFKDIRTDLNMDEERKKNSLRILSNKLFKLNSNEKNNISFDKADKDELLSLLKEENSRSYFFKFLLKLKSKKYNDDDNLFKDLSEIFNSILEICEEAKDYESAQNCIITSQSLYNENKSKKKKYLIDYIRDNKWLNKIEFWEGLIDCMIEKEKTKNEKFSTSKDENEKKSNLKNIAFSNVFSYSNNMLEFNLKKDDIISLVEKLSKKYEIEKEMVDSIVDNINNIINNKALEEEKKRKIEEAKKEEDKKNVGNKIEIIKDYFSAENEVNEDGNENKNDEDDKKKEEEKEKGKEKEKEKEKEEEKEKENEDNK